MLKKEKILKQGMFRFISKLPIYVSMLIFVCMSSCEIPYEAEVDEMTGIISIEGSLVKGESVQTVVISRSSSLYNPKFEPVQGCIVSIIDEPGNIYPFKEVSKGTYEAEIADENLVYDSLYKLNIISPDDEIYESSFEKLIEGPEVDSVYFTRDLLYDEDREIEGIQFYLDLKGEESDSRYYRWILDETWEYHSISLVNYIYIDAFLNMVATNSPDELYYCWKTEKVPGLYSSSTVNLSSNQKKMIPLHFVSGRTNRLKVKYSLLVKQYSLTEGAYNFWNQTKVETEASGGIHTQQPGQTQSNICNVNDSKEVVLGYFWAATKTEKRIFVPRPRDFFFPNPPCSLEPFDPELMGTPPIYIYADRDGNEFTSSPECMNCLIGGGVNSKPKFWE